MEGGFLSALAPLLLPHPLLAGPAQTVAGQWKVELGNW